MENKNQKRQVTSQFTHSAMTVSMARSIADRPSSFMDEKTNIMLQQYCDTAFDFYSERKVNCEIEMENLTIDFEESLAKNAKIDQDFEKVWKAWEKFKSSTESIENPSIEIFTPIKRNKYIFGADEESCTALYKGRIADIEKRKKENERQLKYFTEIKRKCEESLNG